MIGAKAILRRKTNDSWTRKHRHVMRKWVVDGCRKECTTLVGRTKKNRGCDMEEGTEKLDPRGIGEMGTQSWNVEGALEK